MIVNLQIDRLVLEGLPYGSHHAPLIRAAVERELARVIAQNALESGLRLGAVARVGTNPVRTQSAPVENTATQIAEAVFGELVR
ncbi:hypothetical protein [Allosphingosinicella deserti]|uniref:Uncharacterized protein n=1 Tax=Allosphingosinicella deserti TaxID=2116704 RepID=A0A2P7QZG5_9SPHN|nr:hypothetical protein [Sphingomonas deserti]PSJ43358.1 hypothetical protein C7I55_03050 [Sphingomonas deserti]